MKFKFYPVILLLCSFFTDLSLLAQPTGYHYVRELVVQESQIPDGASLTDFPLLVQLTDAGLRSVPNGGHVESSSGHDILFYLNGCATKLDHQLEYYDPVSGTLTAWVRIPSLSTTSNTAIYLYYGNNSVLSSTSVTSVWDANYAGVWHLQEDPGGTAPQMLDGTSHGRHGTANGTMTIANSVIGKMGRALSFDEVNDHVRIPDFLYGQELTVSFWFNLPEVNGNSYQYLFSHGPWATQNSLNVYMGEDNITIPAEIPNRQMLKSNYRDNNDANNFDVLDAGNTFVDGNWHYYCIRIQDFGGATVYIDGTAIVNYTVWGANSFDPVTDIFLGGREDLHAQRFFGGLLDEARISSAWRSSNWISTEYNNQQSPGSFISAGPELSASSFCGILPIRLTAFTATRTNSFVELNWVTQDQTQQVHYSILRSANGNDWETIGERDNINRFTDSFPPKRALYYRLRYVENGSPHFSVIRKVSEQQYSLPVRLYPNPAAGGRIYAHFNSTTLPMQTRLYDGAGRFIRTLQQQPQGTMNVYYDLPLHLPKGMYSLQFVFEEKKEQQLFMIR